MKKLERLSKQLSSVEEIDSRLSISIRKVTQIVIQDVKFEIISNRTKIESTRYVYFSKKKIFRKKKFRKKSFFLPNEKLVT